MEAIQSSQLLKSLPGVEVVRGASGVCSAGVTQCSNGGIVCRALRPPSAEICDGQDNDCNGVVDDNCSGGTSPGQP